MCSLREPEPSLGLVDCRERERAEDCARLGGGVVGSMSTWNGVLSGEGAPLEQEVEGSLPESAMDMGGRMEGGAYQAARFMAVWNGGETP